MVSCSIDATVSCRLDACTSVAAYQVFGAAHHHHGLVRDVLVLAPGDPHQLVVHLAQDPQQLGGLVIAAHLNLRRQVAPATVRASTMAWRSGREMDGQMIKPSLRPPVPGPWRPASTSGWCRSWQARQTLRPR